MTTSSYAGQVRRIILDALRRVAPEAEPELIDPTADLRDQLDIDSMDFLNIVIGVHKRTGVDIPEPDYPKLTTLNGFVDYVDARMPSVQ